MTPRLSQSHSLEPIYQSFLDELAGSAYSGDIETSYGARMAQAVDNSVYQFVPQGILYPKNHDDVARVMRLAAAPKYDQINVSARGGCTGTNGQSLNFGLIMDLSLYLNQVLEINAEEGWARVQAGVVKDALNDALRPHGLFFSPDLSTSNRATIGGMINTDASGAGSLKYGKTSDHVLGLKLVLANGTSVDSDKVAKDAFERQFSGDALELSQSLAQLTLEHREEIDRRFPKLNRFLTGYDLKHVWDKEFETFDLSRIVCGSEGTLALVTEAKLNLTPIPQQRVLVNVSYASFEAALRHAPALVIAKATAVETIDSKVLGLAKQDIIWHSVEALIEGAELAEMDGLNMVEFAGEPEEVIRGLAGLESMLTSEQAREQGVIGFKICRDLPSINKIYAMRKKAVGLLGAAKGSRKPIAFAEDTAVPPEKLADFIMEFRELLDNAKLDYGMFGHVDAGVLHVRPALDMCDPSDEALLRQLSDQVAELTHKYGGLMWGEHGKGVRGEYAPAVFGETLYGVLRQVKALFDPDNKLNPGKLVTPANSNDQLIDIDAQKRGSFDRQIPVTVKQSYPDAMNCNGNGLCFNYSHYSPMCPSFKVSGNRQQSPKGRATLMREWIRQVQAQGVDPETLADQPDATFLQKLQNTLKADKEYDFSHEVMDAMRTCLACKACTGQCPVKVDVPKFRSEFIELYHKRYLRPVKDYLVAGIEDALPMMERLPRLTNFASQNPVSKWVVKHGLGYVDAPKLSYPTLRQQLAGHPALGYDLETLQAIPESERQDYVLIVQDPFNSFYDAQVVARAVLVCELLGFKPVLLPYKPNGKPMHIKGFLKQFAKTAQSSADFLNQLSQLGMPMVGVDPALVLTYRDEYRQVLGDKRGDFHVETVQQWLIDHLERVERRPASGKAYTLMSHCTETTALPQSLGQWQTIFEHLGAELKGKALGCCGMAGTYGHETQNLARSKQLFGMGWQQALEAAEPGSVLVAGYSCRSQVKRLSEHKVKHPLEAILEILQADKT
ncbi:D-2-hydroxyglutarate dehydrogenase YdiJ [Paraferrimonas sedimenticola]|uniref:D-2-hydroxyglutarate dehydrogenase n=1 Tax=Paraferrimonas sedimenticola TaxID=375674 RepID=A0AA37RZ64_9GAMM|nr:FAD-binding and (Fe-S)-binding domain-containing protein [Paraferrimonas sedimenticola]GLP97861.1 membrane protein [Paraferrimonas sedimenticola]